MFTIGCITCRNLKTFTCEKGYEECLQPGICEYKDGKKTNEAYGYSLWVPKVYHLISCATCGTNGNDQSHCPYGDPCLDRVGSCNYCGDKHNSHFTYSKWSPKPTPESTPEPDDIMIDDDCLNMVDADYERVSEDDPMIGKLDLLKEASDVINGERQDSYGAPEDSFQIIADFWDTYLGYRFYDEEIDITPRDVAHMMALMKQARMLGQGEDRDNYRDACGYLAIAADRLVE